ncbi:mRNA decay activator protein ZFP36L1-like [Acipenser ruthenus]|uniref:mRNA decay activator protein ZFP36L1-like n=1 Tax=Acipenser ruthenus TaxID=7906 RepID=UPI00145BA736|nr:mRNA decay activator protein ZFP36L1-like [Acipenser ruthenus]
MSAALVAPYFDFSEVLNKNNRMLNYNNNILSAPHPTSTPCTGTNPSICTPNGTLLGRKAVGTPSTGVYQRRHSVTVPNSKFNQNQFVNSLKTEPCLTGGGGGGGSNKENRFRDRSYSETGERMLQKPCSGSNAGGQVNSSRYKTELCRPFEENGACKYGDKCQFAHGIHELRSLSRHPKYKTELCRTFHTIGFCPYGPRCHFIHNAEERRGPPPQYPLSPSNKLDRPRLQHSFSFAGFPSSSGLQDSPTSVTPPPVLNADDLPEWANNPFTYSSQELATLFGPSLSIPGDSSAQAPPSPTTFIFRAMSESPQMFEAPPSPPDSLSDQEGYLSSSGSISGSESPVLDTNKRLPIFSRLSISDD